ncbi:MAG: hypothetical protein AAGH60_14630 [Pseudomonadota bacterium]
MADTVPVPREFMTRILRENWQLRGALIETQEQMYQLAERIGQHEETVKNLASTIQKRTLESVESG